MGRFRPIILTSGEPAGVAPEITAKAWAVLRGDPRHCFALLGDAEYWQARNPGLTVRAVASLAEAADVFASALPVLHRALGAEPTPGRIDPITAPQVIAAIDEAVSLVMAGDASGMVTNPIHKDALYAAA